MMETSQSVLITMRFETVQHTMYKFLKLEFVVERKNYL